MRQGSMKSLHTHSGVIKKLAKRLVRYRVSIVLSMVLSIISVIASLYVPILVGRAIDCIVDAGRVDFSGIIPNLISIAICVVLNAVCQWLIGICNNRIAYGTMCDIRTEAFQHIQKLPLAYIDAHPVGETVSRIISDAEQLSDGLLLGFSQLFIGVMTILGTMAFMLSVNPLIAAVVILITPVSLGVAGYISKRTYSLFKMQSEVRGEQTGLIDEIIGEQKLVQAFSYQDRAQARFDEVNEKLRACSLRATFYSSLTNPATRFVNALVYAGVGVSGALSVIGGGLSVGGLSVFLSYANQYTKPFNEISGVIADLQGAFACAARLFELIEAPEQPPDPLPLNTAQSLQTLQAEKAQRDAANGSGHIVFNDVCFSYDKNKELITDFSLDVKPGSRVAIVGPTGCGKTTLINLIMRFYEIDRGSITIDGIDTRQMSRKDLRSKFGMVLQDTWLKPGTIRENIALGKPDATDDEILAAAIAAHADSFIKRLPNGYSTIIGEAEGNLSQGQKQLLCIARVMLCLPPMLILDEATSSIDTRTEIIIQDALSRMMKGRTSFIVAHRLSTIREADVILVMKDGSIIEKGKHDELIAKNGFYRELYVSQFAH